MKKTIIQLALTALAAVLMIRCGSSAAPTAPNAPAQSTLSSISLSPSSVVGGNLVTGTVTLTMPAPAGGAVVTLTGGDPVTLPPSVTVPSGAASATFTISTHAVDVTVTRTVNASYGGTSSSATLSVTGTGLATARFGVSGPSETETCELSNSGNTLNCTFDGSTSTAVGTNTIVEWDWSYGVAATFAKITTGPVLAMPAVDCTVIPAPPFPAGTTWFPLVVTLKVHDNLGNVSEVATDSGSRLFPHGECGFP